MKTIGVVSIIFGSLAVGVLGKLGYDKYKLSKVPKETNNAAPSGGGGGGGGMGGGGMQTKTESVTQNQTQQAAEIAPGTIRPAPVFNVQPSIKPARVKVEASIRNNAVLAQPAASFSGLANKYKHDVY